MFWLLAKKAAARMLYMLNIPERRDETGIPFHVNVSPSFFNSYGSASFLVYAYLRGTRMFKNFFPSLSSPLAITTFPFFEDFSSACARASFASRYFPYDPWDSICSGDKLVKISASSETKRCLDCFTP